MNPNESNGWTQQGPNYCKWCDEHVMEPEKHSCKIVKDPEIQEISREEFNNPPIIEMMAKAFNEHTKEKFNKEREEILRRQSTREFTCGICHKKGHTNRYCPDQECFTCNNKGHQSRDCPNKRRPDQSNNNPRRSHSDPSNQNWNSQQGPSRKIFTCKYCGENHRNENCKTHRVLKENASLLCGCNAEGILLERQKHVNWASYSKSRDQHHCCNCNRPTASENLHYIQGLYTSPRTFEPVFLPEQMMCISCYREHIEELDLRDERAQKYYQTLGQGRLATCYLCGKQNLKRKMEDWQARFFCNKEEKFANLIYLLEERITDDIIIMDKIHTYTRNRTNIHYHINESKIRRIYKYMNETDQLNYNNPNYKIIIEEQPDDIMNYHRYYQTGNFETTEMESEDLDDSDSDYERLTQGIENSMN